MGKKEWQSKSHLWGCPIKPLLGWHKPTQKIKKEVKTHDRKAEKEDG